ncbi:hypothetical protein Mapa_007810 [Marchantia paleacea]|nr:hypothetical protein Mapa_007810 [Marchantia paleacea]
MAESNLRPLSAACSLLIGPAQDQDGADRDLKQREWIWEFFLKSNTNGRLLLELMTALPFPNENLNLKRLLLLRSLSLQLSLGQFDELTLDILKALGEMVRKPERSQAGIGCCEASDKPAKKRRATEKGKKHDTRISKVEATKVSVKRGLPESLVGKKSKKSCKERTGEERRRDANQTEELSPSGDAIGLKDGSLRTNFAYLQGGAPPWELQLAVMVELTVKHLRGVSLSKKAFEAALGKYWGDFIMDTEEPVAERLSFDIAREEIRNELWKVHSNLDLLDEITHKYTEERVRNKLASFLREAWANTQECFLETVSSDVVNGTYEPLNPDVQRRNVGAVVGEDGVAVNGRELTSEKPWVRSSRGRFSRSREKLQKAFGVFEINARREVEQSGNPMDGGDNEKNTEVVKTCKINDILGPPLLQTRTAEVFLPSATDASIAITLKETITSGSKDTADTAEREIEEFDHEETGRSQPCDRVLPRIEDHADLDQDGDLSGKETLGDREVRSVSTSPVSPTTRGNLESYREDRKGKGSCFKDEASSEGACDRTKCTDMQGACPQHSKMEGTAVETINLLSPSPRPLAEIQGSLSPPPWAARLRPRRKLAPALDKNQTTGPVQVYEGNTRVGESSGAGSANENSGPDSAEKSRNNGNMEAQPEVVLQYPSSKIRETAAAKPSFLQRNSTARTLEWEDEDDISESPPSPSESRRVGSGRTSALIATRRASSQASTQRRKPRKWSKEETELLKSEVFKYGKGRWKLILANNQTVFESRTEVDLKDKWRNLERFEGLSVRDE